MNIVRFSIPAAALVLAGLLWMQMRGADAPAEDSAAAPESPAAFAIRDVRVFDGERFVPRATVLVRDGLIAGVGPDLVVPEGMETVDGTGRTLLPGFIDAHVHTWGEARRDALRFGVTTMIDMFSDHRQLAAAREERASVAATNRADLWSAGTLATADGGHGTQYGLAVPTLAAPADAPAWVAARIGEGSDFIKIVREDLHVYDAGRPLPTLDAATVAAVVAAAHAAGKRAVVHASAREHAHEALRDRADGLVHVFQDEPADAAFVALARERGAFVVPTLSVIASMSGRSDTLADDPRLRGWLSAEQRQSLATRMSTGNAPRLLANALASVRALHDAGVPILAGTDAPNPGTAHGAAMHGELALLAEAGLSPAAVLAAATSAPALAFGLEDRGRIATGLRADLLLVEGDPSTDLGATRAIARIWKNGRPVDRRVVAEDSPRLEPGPVSHFDGERLDSRFDGGWIATSDQMAGGTSDARVARVAGGAEGSAGAMRVAGTVRAGASRRWAGAFLSPGQPMMQAMDGRDLRRLAFHVRGDGPLAVLLFTGAQGAAPAVRMIESGPDWREVELDLADFAGADLQRLRALAITTDVEGPFAFELDQVEIR